MLVVKRFCIVGTGADAVEVLVPIATASVSVKDAQRKLTEIGRFPERVSTDDLQHGDLLFEVETRFGDLIGNPVRFPAALAQAVLERTGMPADRVTTLLSDAYARGYEQDLRDQMLASRMRRG